MSDALIRSIRCTWRRPMETRWQKRWRIESNHRHNLDETDVHRHLKQRRRTPLTSFTSTSILCSFYRGTSIGHSPTFLCPSVSSDLFHHEIIGQRKWSRNKHPVHQHTHFVDEWNDAIDFVTEETQDREATGQEVTQDSHWIAKEQNVDVVLGNEGLTRFVSARLRAWNRST